MQINFLSNQSSTAPSNELNPETEDALHSIFLVMGKVQFYQKHWQMQMDARHAFNQMVVCTGV